MKKLLAALAVGTLALAGCSSGTDSANDDTFTVGMECGYQPFNWQTSDAQTDSAVEISGGGGYCDGYDVMMSQAIADELGQKLEVKKISWDGLSVALESGEIDAIIAGMTANETREEGIDFTTPYYDSEGMIMIVRKDGEEAKFTDIQQFSGKNVVGQKGTNYDDVIDQIKGVHHATAKATYPEMVVALQQGDVDGITAEMAVAEGVVSANKDLTIVHFDEGKGFECDTTVSIGLKEGTRDSEFFKQVQASLDKITPEERKQLMTEAVNRQPAGE